MILSVKSLRLGLESSKDKLQVILDTCLRDHCPQEFVLNYELRPGGSGTCQGSWWPSMDFREGFTLWRHLGLNSAGEAIAFPALTAIHYVHRLMAFVVLGAMVWLGWRLWRVQGRGRTARALLLLALWQFTSGLTNVVLDWPLLAAVGHTAGAAALVIVFTGALSGTRSATQRRAEAASAAHLNMSRSTP